MPLRDFLPQVLPLMPPLVKAKHQIVTCLCCQRESHKKSAKLPDGTATCGRTHMH